MPIRAESYASSVLPPPFTMNKPEGWLFQQIVERMAKFEQLDDMRLLSIVGGNQIGRLSYALPGAARAARPAQVGLDALLKREPTRELLEFLAEIYFDSGISGVQPKVLIPDADKVLNNRASVLQPGAATQRAANCSNSAPTYAPCAIPSR